MVGGEDAPVEVAMEILHTMASYVYRMGGPGTGHVAKTLWVVFDLLTVH